LQASPQKAVRRCLIGTTIEEQVCRHKVTGVSSNLELSGEENLGMRLGRSLHFGFAFLAAAVFLAASAPAHPKDSQSQENQSVADAARRAREKKKNSTKASKVITDEDVNHNTLTPGQEGLNVGSPPNLETAPPNPAAVAATEATDKASEEAATKKAGDEDVQISKLKEQVAVAEKDLDLARRQLALDSDAYYSKPDFANDTAGKANLDSEQQQIGAKQQELEALKARLADLKELQSRRKPARSKPAPAQPAPSESAPNEQNEKPADPTPPQS
jgi:hypothetical protein